MRKSRSRKHGDNDVISRWHTAIGVVFCGAMVVLHGYVLYDAIQQRGLAIQGEMGTALIFVYGATWSIGFILLLTGAARCQKS